MVCLFSVVTLLINWSSFADPKPLQPRHTPFKTGLGLLSILFLIPCVLLGLHYAALSNRIIMLLGVGMFCFIAHLSRQQSQRQDSEKINLYLLLGVTSILFWMIYFTGPMGITLFIKNNVDKQFFHYEMATQWILNINTLVVIIGAPLVGKLILSLQTKGISFPLTSQFKVAFILLSLSFFTLSLGIKQANAQGYTHLLFIFLYTCLQSSGELFIAPAGLAMIGRLVPSHLQSLFMGAWLMSYGMAAIIAHSFSNAMMKTPSVDPLLTNADYQEVFMKLGGWALVGALFLYTITKQNRFKFYAKINSMASTKD